MPKVKSGLVLNQSTVTSKTQKQDIQESNVDDFYSQNAALQQALGISPTILMSQDKQNETHDYLEKQLNTVLGQNQNGSMIKDKNRSSVKGLKLPLIDDFGEEVSHVPKQLSHLPDFIIDSLCQSLQMQPSQATALLAGNQKFLVYLCVKGMTGKDYSKIVKWYSFLYHQIPQLAQLLMIEQENPTNIFRALNIIKCGLYSHNLEVVIQCSRVINKLWDEIRNMQQFRLQQYMYDWFTSKTDQILSSHNYQFVNKQVDIYYEWLRIPKTSKEIEDLVNEPGICSYIRAWWLFQNRVIDELAQTFDRFGEVNQLELIVFHLRRHFQNTSHYLLCISDLFNYLHQDIANLHLQMEVNIINQIIVLCLQLAKDSFNVSLNEKIISQSLLIDIWQKEPDTINLDNTYQDQILQVLKHNARDPTQGVLRITSTHFLFMLLNSFAQEKNKQAPAIYKALTFMLIEFYDNNELREEMLKSFWMLFTTNQHIPVAILLEPLVEQIKINLQKQIAVDDNSSIQATQINPRNFSINVSEIDFFLSLAQHPRLSAQIAIKLLDISCMIARQHILFTRVSLKLTLTILNRFQGNSQFSDKVYEIVKTNLKLIQDQDQTKIKLYKFIESNTSNLKGQKRTVASSPKKQNKKSLVPVITRNEGKGFGNYPATDIVDYPVLDDKIISGQFDAQMFPDESDKYNQIKINEKMIINLMQCLVHSGHQIYSDFILEQICKTYTYLENKMKFRNKGLFYLLGLFDKDVFALLKRRSQKLLEQKRSRNVNQQNSGSYSRNISKDRISIGNPINSSMENLNEIHTQSSVEGPVLSSMSTAKRFSAKPNNNKNVNLSRMQSPYKAQSTKKRLDDQESIEDEPYSLKTRKKKPVDHTNNNRYLNDGDNVNKTFDDEVGLNRIKIKKKSVPVYRRRAFAEPSLATSLYELFIIQSAGAKAERDYVESVTHRLKIYTTLFEVYAKLSQVNKDYKGGSKTMHLQEVFIFLRDFKITMAEQKLRDEVKVIVKLINVKLDGINHDPKKGAKYELNQIGFIEFILQIAYAQYKDFTKVPAEFMSLFFNHLRNFNLHNPQLIRMFARADEIAEKKLIKELNHQLKLNPHFQMPPGYSKQIQTLPPIQSQQICSGILNDILQEQFEFKVPGPTNQLIWKAKKDTKREGFTSRVERESGDGTIYSTPGSQKLGPDRQRLRALKGKQGVLLSDGSETSNSQLNRILQRPTEKSKRHNIQKQSMDGDDAINSIQKLINQNEQKQLFQRQTHHRKRSEQYGNPSGITIDGYNGYQQQMRSVQNLEALHQNRGTIDVLNHGLSKINKINSPQMQHRQEIQMYKPLNQVQSNKYLEKQQEITKKMKEDEKRNLRNQSLKKKLNQYQPVRKKMEQDALEKLNKKLEEEQKKQKTQEDKKVNYYSKIKQKYDRDRLPEIQMQRQVFDQKKQFDKEEQEFRKEIAKQNTKNFAKELSKKFKFDAEIKKKKQMISQNKELQEQDKIQRMRNKSVAFVMSNNTMKRQALNQSYDLNKQSHNLSNNSSRERLRKSIISPIGGTDTSYQLPTDSTKKTNPFQSNDVSKSLESSILMNENQPKNENKLILNEAKDDQQDSFRSIEQEMENKMENEQKKTQKYELPE